MGEYSFGAKPIILTAKKTSATNRAPRQLHRMVPPKMVNLALQGGGSHGAFTWGVVDRLLEDGRIGIDAISGTSAGSMNAVVIATAICAVAMARARRCRISGRQCPMWVCA